MAFLSNYTPLSILPQEKESVISKISLIAVAIYLCPGTIEEKAQTMSELLASCSPVIYADGISEDNQ